MNYFEDDAPQSVSLTRSVIIFIAIIAALVVTTWTLFGPAMIEKLATGLLMPVGVLWLLLIFNLLICLFARQRTVGMFTLLGLLILTVFGNCYISNQLMYSLEKEFLDRAPVVPGDIGTVVLLGGSTTTDLRGRAQLDSSGDRVASAARYYHASRDGGFAVTILCTGTQVYRTRPEDLDPRFESRELLIALGVASADIQVLEGRNTSQEMRNLKTWLQTPGAQRGGSQKLGILTSTWHLGRAMRLAESNGVVAAPMISDTRSNDPLLSVGAVIPTAKNLENSALAIKEYLAALVSR